MKKLFLLSIAAGLTISSFAQVANFTGAILPGNKVYTQPEITTNAANKTTTVIIHDSLLMTNVTSADTATEYYISRTGTSFDSGFFGGMNFLNMTAFAERYDFKSPDSSVQVIGVIGLFGGHVNPASTNHVTLKVWSQGSLISLRSTMQYNGIPSTLLDSVNVPFTNLGVTDTTYGYKPFYFATPTAYLTDSFFVGYSMNYIWGSTNSDTLDVATTRNGGRASVPYFISAGDTVVNNVSMTQITGLWADTYNDLSHFKIDYYIFPIINSKIITVGVKGIGNKDFTFLGNYPNPAVNSTNIKFSLKNSTDVTIQVMDVNGRTVNTINESNLSAGEHIINLNTANLAVGDYVYLIRTTDGGGIASKITVIK